MKLKTSEQYEVRAQVAKALAHPSRLLIIDALGQKELCVGELTEILGVDQSTVSKHLVVLKQAGLVGVRNERTRSIYSLKACCLEGFWQCIESVLRDNLACQQKAVGKQLRSS